LGNCRIGNCQIEFSISDSAFPHFPDFESPGFPAAKLFGTGLAGYNTYLSRIPVHLVSLEALSSLDRVS